MESSNFVIPPIPKISIPFLEEVPLLLMFFISFFVIYVIVSIILMYHWSQYGTHKGIIIFAETLFVVVSVILFVIAFLTLSYY